MHDISPDESFVTPVSNDLSTLISAGLFYRPLSKRSMEYSWPHFQIQRTVADGPATCLPSSITGGYGSLHPGSRVDERGGGLVTTEN